MRASYAALVFGTLFASIGLSQEPMPAPKPTKESTQEAAPSANGLYGALLVDSDEACELEIGGHRVGKVEVDRPIHVPLEPGPHAISCTAADGVTLRQMAVIEDRIQKVILMQFKVQANDAAPVVRSRDGLEYVPVPAGDFLMGCSSGDSECAGDEWPQHGVRISHRFWISRNEVTWKSFRIFCGSHAGVCPAEPTSNEDVLPVSDVSWEIAKSFCGWAGGRLPTEAEWEYAARGGRREQRYPTGNEMTHEDANFSGSNGRDQWLAQSPVGSFAPNGYGLFDMSGNLWEWCADWYSSSYYGEAPLSSPTGPRSGLERVLRGGAWNNLASRLRTSARSAAPPATRLPTIGFRCVRDIP